MQAPDSIARFRLENTTTSTSTTVAPPPTEFIPATSSTSTYVRRRRARRRRLDARQLPRHRPAWSWHPPSRRRSTAAGAGAELQFAGPWDDGATIPVEFTCDGDEAVPLITWTAPPDGTAELAVSVVDRDADGFVHWLVVGLPPEAGSVGGGEPLVTGATEGVNSFGDPGWAGPCPPPGDRPHTYQFTLHVLDQATELPRRFADRRPARRRRRGDSRAAPRSPARTSAPDGDVAAPAVRTSAAASRRTHRLLSPSRPRGRTALHPVRPAGMR